MIGTTSSGISGQLGDIYSIYKFSWNVVAYEWNVYKWKIRKLSFLAINFEV
jgi:hypothetical protein